MGLFNFFKSKPISLIKIHLPKVHHEILKNCKVGKYVSLYAKPRMDEVIIYAPGSIGGSGKLGAIEGKYGTIIKNHILGNKYSPNNNYKAILSNISEYGCSIEITLLSPDEVKTIDNTLEKYKEDSRKRLNKVTVLKKPVDLKFFLLEPDIKVPKNIILNIYEKEIYIENPFEYKVQLIDSSDNIIAETISQKTEIYLILQAYFSGQKLNLTNLKKEKDFIKATITGVSLSEETKESKEIVKRQGLKNKIKWGEFEVSGYHYLPEEVKKIVCNKLTIGDDLHLIPDPNNKHDDKAIKVVYEGNQIGWVPKNLPIKNKLFDLLLNSLNVKATCKRIYKVDNRGFEAMSQLVVVKYVITY